MKRSTQMPYLAALAVAVLLTAGGAAATTANSTCTDGDRQEFLAQAQAGATDVQLGQSWAHCDASPTTTQIPMAGKSYLDIGDTFYEHLNSCGYHPQGEIVTCDVEVKQTTGFGGFPAGSNEYVRFCFDCNKDGIWEDSTLGIVHVTDDVSGGPLSFYFNAYATTNDFCPQNDGQDFRILAVLAWQQPLTHQVCANPGQVVWGNGIVFSARRDP